MSEHRFTIFSRRIYCRPWQRHVSAHFLIGAFAGALVISFFGGNFLAAPVGLFNGMIIASFGAAFFLAALFWCVFPAGMLAQKIGLRRIGKKELLFISGGVLLLLAGSMILTGVWQQILDLLQISYEKEQDLLQIARDGNLKEIGQLIVLTAVAVPIVEELLFRRCLYGLLLKFGAPAAFIGSALLFSAAHGFLAGVPGLFFIGAGLQIICNMTRNLWCSIIAHGLLNLSVVIITCLTACCEKA